MDMDSWPDCAVKGCPNKCCLRLASKYCWPHTPGTPSQALENLMESEPIPPGVIIYSTVNDPDSWECIQPD